MSKKCIEIRYNNGSNNYDTILYPVTKMSQVIFKETDIKDQYISAEEELVSLYNLLSNTKVISSSSYICNKKNESIIKINNLNYNYLDSELEVYYNGLLLINNYHYILYDEDSIKLLDFSLNLDDELIFKVFNINKVNIDIGYDDINDEKGKELKDIIDSMNEYINFTNKGKKLISDTLKKADVKLEWNDTYESYALAIEKVLSTHKKITTDFGMLFARPYYEYNISFDLGSLYGVEIEKSILPNDLGELFLF